MAETDAKVIFVNPAMQQALKTFLDRAATRFVLLSLRVDPHILHLIEKTAPIRAKLRWILMKAFERTRWFVIHLLRFLLLPFYIAHKIASGLIGTVRLEYRPSTIVAGGRTLIGSSAKEIRHLYGRITSPLNQLRANQPPVFRTAMATLLVFGFFLGGCSTFQIFKKMTRVQVSVEGPEYRKPVDDTIPAPVRIRFSSTVGRLDLIGKKVEIQTEPALAGIWTLVDDSTLLFTPSVHWPPDREYKVILPPQLLRPGTVLAEDKAIIKTPVFSGRVSSAMFYVDPSDPSVKKAVVTIEFNYPVDASSLENNIAFKYKALAGKKIGHSVQVDASGFVAYVHSEIIPIQDDEARIQFTADRGIKSRDGARMEDDLEAAIQVPGRYTHFQITGARIQLVRNESYELDQVLFLESSANVTKEELLKNLSAYELPADRPESPGTQAEKDHVWNNPEEIDAHILAKARKLSLSPVEGENEDGTIHPFHISATEGRYLYVRVNNDTRAVGDYLLKKPFQTIAAVPAFQREVRIMHDGAILSLAGEKRISILSYDNDVIEFEVGRILPDQINHLVSQSSGNFRSPYFRNYSFNEENMAKRYVERVQLHRQPGKRLQYASFDFSKYLQAEGPRLRHGLFYLKARGYLKSELAREQRKKKKPAEQVTGENTDQPTDSTNPSAENTDVEGDGSGIDGSSDESTSAEDSDTEQEEGSLNYTRGGREDRRFILVSDLGLIAKASRTGVRDMFVQSFATGLPVAGADISVIGKNGIPILTRKTDAAGHASFPDLADFQHEKQPVAFTARVASDLSFLPFDREDRKLNFSRFDVGGLHGADAKERLSAYVFSDRGIYRPGDEIRGAFMIKSGDWQKSLAGLPIEVSVHDSRGLQVSTKVVQLSPMAFEEFHYRTEESAPTGSYEIRVSLISKKNMERTLLGSATVKVEEFQPDRLRITAAFSTQRAESEGWIKPEKLKGQVLLMNLFGTPAQHKKVRGTLILVPRAPSFPGYEGYHFHDPLRTGRSFQEELGTLETDEQGRVEFPLNLERSAQGIYRVTFHADGYEAEGGRAVSVQSTQIVSPLDHIIGIKMDGEASYIRKGSTRQISIIAVSPLLKRVEATGLRLKIVESRHVSSLVKREDGIYEYKSTIKEIPVIEQKVSLPAAGLNFALPTNAGGDFVLTLFDSSDRELNRLEFSVIGEGNVARSLEKNAELSLHLNGKDFSPGEEIEVSIRAPYTGAGLITIEKDRVYAQKWFHSSTESSVQRIRLPENLEGNGYVNVTFVRAIDSKAIYTSPLSYGVVPFSVSKKGRTAHLQLQVPTEIRPGSPLTVHYSTDRSGRLVLYAVDAGILQAANYRTPDPLGHFFQRRALEVSTSQIVDQLLPEFSLVHQLMKIGGDSDRLLGLNLNPFKRRRQSPVVFWSGIRDAAGQGDITFQVPDYFNGQIRVFGVLVNETVIGVDEKSTLVRGDFILSPSVAAFASPGDQLELSVNVANNIAGSGKDLPVSVSVRAEGSLRLEKAEPTTVKISERGEATAKFQITALNPGEGRLIFTATGKGRSNSQTETLSVRPARPYIVDVQSGFLTTGSDEIPLNRDLYPDFKKVEVAVSPVPLAWSSGFYQYLSKYPYGCTEQLTSRGLAALILRGRTEFKPEPAPMNEMVQHALNVLQARQNEAGAFGFWAANSSVDPFQSVYALLFLTEAKERGVKVPAPLLSKGLDYLDSLLNHPDRATLHDRAFGLYVLTRNGRLRVNELNSLLGELNREKDDSARLPMMYLAATRKLMRQDAEADDLFSRSQPIFYKRWLWDSFDPVSAQASYMFLLSRHFPGRFGELGEKTMTTMLSGARSGEISTISSATMILAIDAYMELRKGQKLDLSVMEETATGIKRPLSFADQAFARAIPSADAVKLHFNGKSPLPSFYQLTVGGFDRKPAVMNSGIEISREYRDGEDRTLSTARVGNEVIVHVRIRSLEGRVPNVAIVDLFPAGWEPVRDQPENETPPSKGILGPERMRPTHVDFREDRVLLFTQAETKMTEYVYRLRPTAVGRFTVPPLFAEGMYNRKMRALTAEGVLVVESRP